MAISRATANTKLLSKHQRKNHQQSVKSSSAQFTQKQSHFERRQEEKYVKRLRQHSASSLLEDSNGNTGPGLKIPSSSAVTAAAQAPFSSRFLGESSIRSSSSMPAPALVTGGIPFQGSPSSLLLPYVGRVARHTGGGHSGRSCRRAERYQLQDEKEVSDPAPSSRMGGSHSGEGRIGSGGETLLGLRRITFEDDEHQGGSGGLHSTGQGGTPGAGVTSKEERFRLVMENSKRHRMEKQRDRSEADATTIALDEAFTSLRYLLPMRDRKAEEQKAFQESGTPEVRALLKAYKKKRGKVPRMLVIRTRKEGEIPSSATQEEEAAKQKKEASIVGTQEVFYVVPLLSDKDKKTKETDEGENFPKGSAKIHAPPPSSIRLSMEDLQRLEDIRRFGEKTLTSSTGSQLESVTAPMPKTGQVELHAARKDVEEEEDIDGITAIEDAKREFVRGSEKHHSEASTRVLDEELDFDRTMQLFMMGTRRARATQRLLTEEEQEVKRAEELRLEQDRALIPGVGAQEAVDQIQWTRREWLERGGDQPFQMGKGGMGVDQAEDEDDGISLSSIDSGEEEEEEEEDPTAESVALVGKGKKMANAETKRSPGGELSGSPVLDGLLASLEKLIVGAPPLDLHEEEEKETKKKGAKTDGEGSSSGETNPHPTGRNETTSTVSSSLFFKKYHAIISKMYQFGQQSPLLLANTFRLIIMEAERVSLRGHIPSPSLGTLLVACTQLFPMTDYRHPVSLPLLLYLGSAVFQLRLQSRQQVKGLVFFAALLTRCVVLTEGRKFVPEAIIAALNVVALQLPLFHLVRDGSRYQGLRVSFPLVERPRVPHWVEKGCLKNAAGEGLEGVTAAGGEERRAEMQDPSLYLPVLCCRGVERMKMMEAAASSVLPPKSEGKGEEQEKESTALLQEIQAKSKVHLLALLTNEKMGEKEKKKNKSILPPYNTSSSSSGSDQHSNSSSPSRRFLASSVYIPENVLLTHENWESRIAEDEHLLCVGYSLLLQLADAYYDIAAFSPILKDPMEKIHQLLVSTTSVEEKKKDEEAEDHRGNEECTRTRRLIHNGHSGGPTAMLFEWRPSPVLSALHQRLRERLAEISEEQISKRTPLAMRTFRPRPLRLFDPLLEEREEIAVKSEVRELKKTLREDRKRVMRHVQAEATVTKRQREAEQALQEQERQKAYNRVLGQLQAQQHIMNTVDAAMERGKKRVRKGLSGAPKTAGDGVLEY